MKSFTRNLLVGVVVIGTVIAEFVLIFAINASSISTIETLALIITLITIFAFILVIFLLSLPTRRK